MGSLAVGDVVLVPFPFSDVSDRKLRPAFVAAEAEQGDLILCQITSRPWGHGSAMMIDGSSATRSGLDRTSYLRPDKLFTADARIVVRRLGDLEPDLIAEVRRGIRELFT